ncbi:NAD(P)/FAD-dependent oxidoreductase [Asanoa sp. NPDC049518]|uniref:NAD(P)/FAD-dependent oxidoreductase n=1 Tax=unclassified Asanoa TaxID=2685164 RepID=UPI00343ADEC5
MAPKPYDVIVVGARCAGSPTAMLLARLGYDVLVVDRATFPCDTVSTHIVHPPGVDALRQWGLLDQLVASGCPAINTYTFDLGPFTISGAPGTDASPVAYAPRRTVLDKLLVDGAAAAGAEVREGFTVTEIVGDGQRVTGVRGHDRDGRTVTERASVVVGADGWRSTVAEAVAAEEYHTRPRLLAMYYSYWSGLPGSGPFEIFLRPERGIAAWPTNDGLTVVITGWPYAEFNANKVAVEANFHRTLALVPSLAERVAAGTREERFAGMATPNTFRRPWGSGWALVGDAGYVKDPVTGQGIQDAFRDATRCVAALDAALTGNTPYARAMAAYQRDRDEKSLPMYEYTCDMATLEPPPPDMRTVLAAIEGDQDANDEFARLNAGVESPAEFFAPDNVARLVGAGPRPS